MTTSDPDVSRRLIETGASAHASAPAVAAVLRELGKCAMALRPAGVSPLVTAEDVRAWLLGLVRSMEADTVNVAPTYTIRVYCDQPDQMWAEVVELPGAFAAGASWSELGDSIREAIEMCEST